MHIEEIIRMATELGNAIAESEPAEELRDVQARLLQDVESYQLIIKYEDMKTKIEHKIEDGLPVSRDEEDQLEDFENLLNMNPLINELIQVQEQFNDLLQAVFHAVNHALSGGCGDDCDCDGMCM